MRLAFFLFLLLRFSQARDAKCAEFYYTREITEEESIKFDYYYTAANVATTKECAVFCAERRFCRSSLYDQTMKACAISYEYTENCRNQRMRYTEDNPIISNQTLLITCIGKCTEHREYEIRRSQSSGRVNIITGEPHDGFLPPIVVEDGNTLKNIKRREQSFLHKSANALGKRERPAIIVGDAHDRSSTTVESRKGLGEGYVNSLILANLTGIRSVASSDIRRADPKRRAGDPPICFRTKKRRYLLGGSFRHVPHTTIDHCRCLCANSWRDSARCESLNYYTNGMCVLNTGSHKGRFDLIDDPSATYQYVACDISMLIGIADIVCENSDSEIPPKPMEQVFTKVWKESKELKESKEASVEATTPVAEREGKKIQTTTSATVLTTTASTTTTSAPETTTVKITERTTQAEVTEDDDLAQLRKKLEEVEKEITEEEKREKVLKEKEAELSRIGERNKKIEEERKKKEEEEKKIEEEKIRKVEEEKKTEEEKRRQEEEENKKKEEKEKEVEKARKEKEEKEREEKKKREEEIKKNAVSDEEEEEEDKPKERKNERRGKKEDKEDEEEEVTAKSEVVTRPSKKEKCFEELFDYVMTSTAGGLEHDVSIDECKCLCANSMTSGRYAFQCRSATYYHNERDCVLNVESRRQRPELLERHYRKTYNVTYLGLQCSIMKAVMDLVNTRLEAGCIQPFAATAPPTTTTTTERPPAAFGKTESGTDSCFLELPHFVLEGTAQAVETEVSVEECKCKCADAERKYGEPCQSTQYFPEERICLLNKKNRFSNPESFNYVPLSPQSYFESKCVSKEDNRAHYLESKCAAYVKVERRKLREDESPEKLDTPEELIEEKKKTGKRDQMKEAEEKKSKREGNTASRNHQKNVDHQDDPAAEKTNKLVDRESEPAPTTTTSTTASTITTTTTTTTPQPITTTTTAAHTTTTKKAEKKPISKVTKKVTKSRREPSTTTTTTTTTTTQKPTTTTTRYRDTVKINLSIPEAEGFDSAELEEFMMHEEQLMSKEVMDDAIEEAMKNSKEETVAAADNSLSDDEKPLSRDYMPESEEDDEEGSSAEVTNTIMEDEAEMYAPRTLHEPSTRPPSTTVAPEITVGTTTVVSTTSETATIPPTTTVPTTTVPPTTTTTVASTTSTAATTTTDDENEEGDEGTTTTEEPSTTTEEPTTTTTEYPPAGPCTYSAIYQTTFHGNKLLKVVSVKSPADCFAACYALGCRSANLYSAGTCELFKDALIDYRRPDVVSYEHGAVYFDGIQCQGPPKVVESP